VLENVHTIESKKYITCVIDLKTRERKRKQVEKIGLQTNNFIRARFYRFPFSSNDNYWARDT